MGWSSSVGLMQMISRELIRRNSQLSATELRRQMAAPPWFVELVQRSEGRQFWQVYLDNYMAAEIGPRSGDGSRSKELHREAVDIWTREGVLCAPDKHVYASQSATELGVTLSGVHSLVGGGPTRFHQLMVVTLMLLAEKCPKVKWVQIVLGRWIFVLQYRRPAMSVLSRCWNYIRKNVDRRRWWPVVQDELSTLLCLAPLLHFDLKMAVSGVVTCSDASHFGGAVAVAPGLTGAGLSLCSRVGKPEMEPHCAELLVISAFNGIGGAFRGYDLAGIQPAGLISIEWDAAARRVTRKAWPQVIEISDINHVNKDMVREWFNMFPRVIRVDIVGGFPCVHLSAVRAGRKNLEGDGSRLFWALLQLIRWVEEVFSPTATVEFVVENVLSMDADARKEISHHLGVEPIALCPSDAMPYNRPRLAWVSSAVHAGPGVRLEHMGDYVRVWMEAAPIPDEAWLDKGWRRCCSSTPLPTFMKAIRRRQPPPQPAGIHRCEADALARWRSDGFKFPPYQYRRQYLVVNAEGDLRYPSASERERLLGFGDDHTKYAMSASSIKENEEGYMDKRLSLLGDSFSMLSFGWVISQLCALWVRPLSPQEILDRMGLAAGATLQQDYAAPIGHGLRYGGRVTGNEKPIHKGKSLAERRAARKGINLRGLGISPKTEARYNSALGTLLPTLDAAKSLSELDPLCEEWVECQWIKGTPLGLIGDALCGLQHYWPQVKGELRGAWKLYRNWRRIEVPQRAPPLPRPIALALIGLFLEWAEPRMAFLLALGFHTFLRTGEMLSLLCKDVHLVPHQHGVVMVRKSKTGLRFNIDEAVAIYDVELYKLWELCHLPTLLHRSQPIWNRSASAFRSVFYRGLDALGLGNHKYQPYSIRRGGATHAFVTQQTLDAILLRGRWRSLTVARLYLEDGQSQPQTQRHLQTLWDVSATACHRLGAAQRRGTVQAEAPPGILLGALRKAMKALINPKNKAWWPLPSAAQAKGYEMPCRSNSRFAAYLQGFRPRAGRVADFRSAAVSASLPHLRPFRKGPGMAPKRGSIEAAFAGKPKGAKTKKAGLEQSTPESKQSVAAVDVTPSPEMPKRRRLEKAPETTPTKVQKDVEMKAPALVIVEWSFFKGLQGPFLAQLRSAAAGK
eukprot:s161_g22.t1